MMQVCGRKELLDVAALELSTVLFLLHRHT